MWLSKLRRTSIASLILGRSPPNAKKSQWEYVHGGIRRAPKVSKCFTRLDLDARPGDKSLPHVHHLLCFTCIRAPRHYPATNICMHRSNALRRNLSKSANRGACFEDSDLLSIRDVIAMTMIWHDLAQEHRMLTVRQKCDAKSDRYSGNPFCMDLPNYVVEPYARKLNLRYNELARHGQAKFPPAMLLSKLRGTSIASLIPGRSPPNAK